MSLSSIRPSGAATANTNVSLGVVLNRTSGAGNRYVSPGVYRLAGSRNPGSGFPSTISLNVGAAVLPFASVTISVYVAASSICLRPPLNPPRRRNERQPRR